MQQGGNNRGCMMFLIIGAVVLFFAFSGGGLGGILGGGGQLPGAQAPSGSGGGSQDGGIQESSSGSDSSSGGLLENLENEEPAEEAIDALFPPEEINGVTWTILEADLLGENLQGELDAENGTFVGVVFTIENQTEDPLTFVGLELVDNQEETYIYSSEALELLGEEGCETETLEPNTVIECTAVYDVYTDAEDLHAVLTDLNMLGGDSRELDLELD